jgi:hypothetical protein
MEQLSGLEMRRDEKNNGTVEWFRNETRKMMEQLSGLETRRDKTRQTTCAQVVAPPKARTLAKYISVATVSRN